MIAMPVLLGIYLARKYGFGWRLWWIGAGTFVLSQVGHIPFNAVLTVLFERGVLPTPPQAWRLTFSAVVLGLSAGIWEEVFRYIAYRWWARDARSWPKGLMLGAGHGGIEAIILGILVMVTVISMVVLRTGNAEMLLAALPPETLDLAREQLALYWSLPWYDSMLGALERLFAITFHLSASILVLQTFLREQIRWLFFAIGWHALLDAAAVYAVATWNAYIAEAIIAVMALVSLGIIFRLKNTPPLVPESISADAAQQTGQPQPSSSVAIEDIIESEENLEKTRFE